jgi:hypothetical protein
MAVAMTLAPGFAGPAAGAVVAAALLVAVVTGLVVAQQTRGRQRVVVGVAVGLLAAFAVTRFPQELNTRRTQYATQAPYAGGKGLAEVEKENGVPAPFLDFANRVIPASATFGVVVGPAATSARQSFAQFVLLPRAEEQTRPCHADWIVFIDHAPRLDGSRIVDVHRFAAGQSVGRVEEPCV